MKEEHRSKMFKNRELRGKRWEITEDCRKCKMRNIIICTIIKSRRMRVMGHVACMGDMRNSHTIFVGNRNGREHFEGLDMHGKIIL
jgi:hypothetical protein